MAFLRQQDIVSSEKLSELSVVIIGTGSIGSFTALTLTKMGIKHLTLFDNDVVQLQNISNQFFIRDHLGEPKVKATALRCLSHAPEPKTIEICALNEFYTEQQLPYQIVIALTDNIEGRAAAFKAAKESFVTEFFIDARMGAEFLRVFALNPKGVEAERFETDYLEGVKNSEEPCTARTIVYNVLMASSLIASYVKKFVNGEFIPFELSFNFKDFSLIRSKEVI